MKVGVLTDLYLHEWASDALERVEEETDHTIELVVVNAVDQREADNVDMSNNPRLSPAAIRTFVSKLREQGPWAFVVAERQLAAKLSGEQIYHWKKHHIEEVDVFQGVRQIDCTPIEDGAWNEFPADVVDELEQEVDVIVRFGFGLVKGDILSATEHGVISFHPADIREYRGVSPARMFLNGDQTATATLQVLSSTIDGGKVVLIDETDTSDAKTLTEYWDRVVRLQTTMLPVGLDRLDEPDFEPWEPETLGGYMPMSTKSSVSFATRVLVKDLIGHI